MGAEALRWWRVSDHRARHYYLNAIRFDGDNIVELPDGDREVRLGDYVIQLDNGVDYWTCTGDVFEKFFEPFSESDHLLPPTDTDDAMAWAQSFESHYPH